MICHLLDQCVDELETFAVEASGKESVAECIRAKIGETYGMKETIPEKIDLGNFVATTIEPLRQMFSHRKLDLNLQIQPAPSIYIPGEVLKKVFTGLIKNAVENTRDGGKIDISVKPSKNSAVLCVHDHGVGILAEHQLRIFEGFFPTQETGQYSSKQPFDFNAGGKGADLLRIKIFSERYGFNLDFESERCRHMPGRADVCPGLIEKCSFCETPKDCYKSGWSKFSVIFLPTLDSKS